MSPPSSMLCYSHFAPTPLFSSPNTPQSLSAFSYNQVAASRPFYSDQTCINLSTAATHLDTRPIASRCPPHPVPKSILSPILTQEMRFDWFNQFLTNQFESILGFCQILIRIRIRILFGNVILKSYILYVNDTQNNGTWIITVSTWLITGMMRFTPECLLFNLTKKYWNNTVIVTGTFNFWFLTSNLWFSNFVFWLSTFIFWLVTHKWLWGPKDPRPLTDWGFRRP